MSNNQVVYVNVKNGPGCVTIIGWIVLFIFVVSLCGVLS